MPRYTVRVLVAAEGGACPFSYERLWPCKDQSACVGRWALCNDVRDCLDNSDEDRCEGTLPEPNLQTFISQTLKISDL